MEPLPFKLNAQTKRLARQLLEFEQEHQASESGADFRVSPIYLEAETPNEASEANIQAFWGYLQEQGAVKLSDYESGFMTHPAPSLTTEPFSFRQEYWLKVLDADPINELLGRGPVSFDSRTDTIHLFDKTIPIPDNTNQVRLCRVLFEDTEDDPIGSEWGYKLMLEAWGEEDITSDDWRKMYDAVRNLNRRVAAVTTVDDLLLIPTQTSVKINPKYLP